MAFHNICRKSTWKKKTGNSIKPHIYLTAREHQYQTVPKTSNHNYWFNHFFLFGCFFFFFWQTECFFNTNPETKEKVVIFQKSRKKNHFLSLFVNVNSKSLISKWNKSRKKINFYILWEETETNISLTPERLYITAPFILDSFPAVVCWYVTLHFP